jgi:arylsulfatase
LIDPKWQLSPTAGEWEQIKNKPREMRCKEVFDAIIDDMDQGIGRIIAELKKDGSYDNTVIFYLHDNGGCAESMGRLAPAGPAPANLKPLGPDDLQDRTKPPMQTRDGRWVRTGPKVMPGGPDTFIAYGKDWANVSNTPFREYKHWVHEGGISTPLIVHWSNGIAKTRQGSIERQPGHIIDIMATCVDLSGASYPSELNGNKIKPMEGVSLRPSFGGESLQRKNPLFWEHENNRAVRDGKWKLVAKADQPWELYDMEADRTEMHDVASSDPAKVKEMAKKWDDWAARSNVLPLGGWKEKGGGKAKGE